MCAIPMLPAHTNILWTASHHLTSYPNTLPQCHIFLNNWETENSPLPHNDSREVYTPTDLQENIHTHRTLGKYTHLLGLQGSVHNQGLQGSIRTP